MTCEGHPNISRRLSQEGRSLKAKRDDKLNKLIYHFALLNQQNEHLNNVEMEDIMPKTIQLPKQRRNDHQGEMKQSSNRGQDRSDYNTPTHTQDTFTTRRSGQIDKPDKHWYD